LLALASKPLGLCAGLGLLIDGAEARIAGAMRFCS
jgi:hypothetical protein